MSAIIADQESQTCRIEETVIVREISIGLRSRANNHDV